MHDLSVTWRDVLLEEKTVTESNRNYLYSPMTCSAFFSAVFFDMIIFICFLKQRHQSLSATKLRVILSVSLDPLYTLSLTSFLALYKWKVSNTQPHLVVQCLVRFFKSRAADYLYTSLNCQSWDLRVFTFPRISQDFNYFSPIPLVFFTREFLMPEVTLRMFPFGETQFHVYQRRAHFYHKLGF